MHIVAGLAERDQLYPVDEPIGIAAARVAVELQPLRDPAGAGIVGGQRQDGLVVEAGELLAQIVGAQPDIVVRVAQQPPARIVLAELA